jgi:tetratricopeptide (TPR) repeat protein
VSATSKFGTLLGVIVLGLMLGACSGPSKRIVQGDIQFTISEGDYITALKHQDDGRYFEAIQAWSKIIAAEPRFGQGHFNLGLIYDKLRMVPEAIEHYELAVRMAEEFNDVDSAHALYNLHLGSAYLSAQLIDEGLHALRRANQLDPYNPTVHYNLSAAYIARNNYDQGLLHADIAVDLLAAPDATSSVGLSPDVDRVRLGQYLLRQAECHMFRGEWDKARVAIERARDQCNADIGASVWDRLHAGEKAEAEEAESGSGS